MVKYSDEQHARYIAMVITLHLKVIKLLKKAEKVNDQNLKTFLKIRKINEVHLYKWTQFCFFIFWSF